MFGFFKKDFDFTDPFNPKIKVNTQEGVKEYLKSLKQLQFDELCKEFSNVMAGKHNTNMVMISLGGINNFNEFQEKQKVLTDLTDRATLICIYYFGHQRLMRYSNNDMRIVNKLVNTCDQEVAEFEAVEPIEHGKRLFQKLERHIIG